MINGVYNMRLLRLSIIFILILLAASPVWAQWSDAVIDTITNTQIRKETELQSLDLDSCDCVHLAWKQKRDGGGWRIFYSTNSPDGVWLLPQEVGDSIQASFSPALAVSPTSNHPFVVFEQNSEIYLAYQSESVWQRQQITSNSQLDCSPTVAVDNLGLIHLAWITDDPGTGEYKIAYALGDSVNWDIQTLVGSDLGPYGTGASPYIDVSPQGVAHIVYRGGTYLDYHIHHAWNDSIGGSDWSYEILTSGNINDFSSALIVEEDGDLHLAVSGNDGWGFPGRVYYFYQPQGQSWESFELTSLSYSAANPSVDIDQYGSPHIIWMETSGNFYTGNIFYSRKEVGDEWQVSFVIGNDYFSPSFKVDRQGFGHVACHTGGNTGIYDIYHIRSAGALTPLVVTSPNGGENWCAGSTQLITWTAQQITNVKIEYSKTGGGPPWETIVDSTPNDGEYYWDIPPDSSFSFTCRVKISDLDNEPSDMSDGNFTIFMAGDVDGTWEVSVGDIIYLINYLFMNTSPPIPLEAADVNLDGVVDVGDVVYLINYLFIDGPAPLC